MRSLTWITLVDADLVGPQQRFHIFTFPRSIAICLSYGMGKVGESIGGFPFTSIVQVFLGSPAQ
jgi:hypothetical protein